MSTVYGYAVVDLTNRPFYEASGTSLFPPNRRAAADRLLRDVTANKLPARLVGLVIRELGDPRPIVGYIVLDDAKVPGHTRGSFFSPRQKVTAEKFAELRTRQGYRSVFESITFELQPDEAKK